MAFVAEEQGAESAQAGVGDLLAHVEIEAVGGAEIGEARGEAQGGEGSRVVPAAEHGFDGAGEEAHHGVAFQRWIEIEARRDAEAFEGGAQCGHVDIGGAHDDGDLAEGAAGGGLFENAAGDLFDFALDAGRLDEGERGMGAAGLGIAAPVAPMAVRRARRAGVRSSSPRVRVRSAWRAMADTTRSSGSGRA